MKRVLIFSPAYHPFIGGAEVAIKEITDRISPEEIEFHLLTVRWDSRLPRLEKMGNVTVHRIGFGKAGASISDLSHAPLSFNKYLYQLWAPIVALHLNRRYHFDAIWAMMAHAAGIPAGIYKFFQPSMPYLLTLQEGDPPEQIEKIMNKPFVWALFKRGFTSADVMQPISTFLQAWGMRMGFTGFSEVIPNGVDVAKFSHAYSAEEIAEMKAKLGKDATRNNLEKEKQDIFLVTTSRLVHKNGIDDVIRALALLPKHISFLIYGSGPDEQMLRALAESLGVNTAEHERARFMGQISHDDMPLILKACDIFIRPSRSEGMGNSFIEAMAARLPVIATQVGGIADFLFYDSRPSSETEASSRKPMTGWAVDVGAPEQIAKAVRDIIDSPEKVAEVTEAAFEMVSEKYEWDTVAAKMRHLFDDLLKTG